MSHPLSPLEADIARAVEVLRRGGVIAYPTDTVWGLGCDASCGPAVKRIYEIKRRADSKAMITLVGDMKMLSRVVGEVPDDIIPLLEGERPTSVVYPRTRGLCADLLALDSSAGVRVTREEFSRKLCRDFGGPIVSTSANLSGQPTPAGFAEIDTEILRAVDYVCQSHRSQEPKGRASRVIKICADGSLKTLRE